MTNRMRLAARVLVAIAVAVVFNACYLMPVAAAAPVQTRVVSAVRAAANATGVPFEYLLAQASQESGLNPAARNRRSSAAGLFQFTAATWLEMIHRHGAAIGLGRYARVIVPGTDGGLRVADRKMRKAILNLRHDPTVSARIAAEYARGNQKFLQSRLGRPVSAVDLYLAHFLGAGGAANLLKNVASLPHHSASRLLPVAARANPAVFRAHSIASLYRAVQARYVKALGATVVAAAQPQPPVDPPHMHQRPAPDVGALVTAAMVPSIHGAVMAAPVGERPVERFALVLISAASYGAERYGMNSS